LAGITTKFVPVESLPMLNLNQNINLSGGLNPQCCIWIKI